MDDRSKNEKLIALALKMPKYGDFIAERYRGDPALALEVINDEFREYVRTNDIRYLLQTLREVAEAKGWSELSRETGLPRSTLYAALSGESDPRISTVMKILAALGVEVVMNIISPGGRETKQDAPEILYG